MHYELKREIPRRKMTTKELAGREDRKEFRKRKRGNEKRKEYRKRKRRREIEIRNEKLGEGEIERAETEEEAEEKMKRIDEKTEGNKRRESTIAGIEERKFTGAIAMVQIRGKQVKALVDSGACATLIARTWVEHLGLNKRVDEEAEVPRDLQGVAGEYLGVKGALQLRMKIGEKEIQWKVWVANRLIMPLILGNDFNYGKSVIDFTRGIWKYEGEEVPIQVMQKPRMGEMITVVATTKMKIPQYAAVIGVGRIVDEGGGEARGRTVEFNGEEWGGVKTQTGIAKTYIRKEKGKKGEEEIKIRYINERKGAVIIRKGDVVGHIQDGNDIVGVIMCSGYDGMFETPKTQEALSKKEKGKEENEKKERGEKKEENMKDRGSDRKGAVVREEGKGADHQGENPPQEDLTVFTEGVTRAERSKDRSSIEGCWPVQTER